MIVSKLKRFAFEFKHFLYNIFLELFICLNKSDLTINTLPESFATGSPNPILFEQNPFRISKSDWKYLFSKRTLIVNELNVCI